MAEIEGVLYYLGPRLILDLERRGGKVCGYPSEVHERSPSGARHLIGAVIDADGPSIVAPPVAALRTARSLVVLGWHPGVPALVRAAGPEVCVTYVPGGKNEDRALEASVPPPLGNIACADIDATRVTNRMFSTTLGHARSLELLRVPWTLELDARDTLANNRLQLLDAPRVTIANAGALRHLRSLRILDLSDAKGVLSPDDFTSLRDLVQLDLSGIGLSSLAGFENLQNLEQLDVSATRISDLTPLRALRRLKTLKTSRTLLTDLTPLAALPELVVVEAAAARVASLPRAGFSRLRRLNLFSSPVPRAELERFHQAHPQVAALHGWMEHLRATVASADRLVLVDREVRPPAVVASLTGRRGLNELLATLSRARERPDLLTGGPFHPVLRFQRGATVLAEVQWMRRYLRWARWPGVLELTPEGRQILERAWKERRFGRR